MLRPRIRLCGRWGMGWRQHPLSWGLRVAAKHQGAAEAPVDPQEAWRHSIQVLGSHSKKHNSKQAKDGREGILRKQNGCRSIFVHIGSSNGNFAAELKHLNLQIENHLGGRVILVLVVFVRWSLIHLSSFFFSSESVTDAWAFQVSSMDARLWINWVEMVLKLKFIWLTQDCVSYN